MSAVAAQALRAERHVVDRKFEAAAPAPLANAPFANYVLSTSERRQERSTMNRMEKKFPLRGEARLKYASGEFQVITPGEFVRCAASGVPVPLDELRYWNVELQEPYASAELALQRHREYLARKRKRDKA